MEMTRYELCVHACKYAVRELVRKGCTAYITSAHDDRQQISFDEVMEWLNQEQSKAEWCKKL